MKRILVLIFGVAVAGVALAQTTASTKVNGPVITWENSSHDFGEMQEGDKVEHAFKFTNTGNEPLIITNVATTCGCTTPKGYPRDPIAVGGKAEIVVAFDSAYKSGRQDKVITVISNAVNPEASQVKFTANVVKKKVQ